MRVVLALAPLGFLVSLMACGSTLTVNRPIPLRDDSAVQPAKRAYGSVMVLPPSGSERGAATIFAHLERALVKRGIRVISSGVTARVAVEETAQGKKTEGATALSDLERALVLARKSNAEALLQVAELHWVDGYRYFIPRVGVAGVSETDSKEDYLASDSGRRVALISGRLTFVGKIIDVDTGEIVASIDLSRSVADAAVPSTYKQVSGEVRVDNSRVRAEITAEIMDRVAKLLSGGEQRPKAETTPDGSTSTGPEVGEDKASPTGSPPVGK